MDSDESDNSAEEPEFATLAPSLPKHFRCASHTFNLLAITDLANILKSLSDEAQYMHKTTFDR